ncbi:MAG: AAA family ATPase [Motiliproteus sp.]
MRIKATYRKHPDPELNGNPLSEAIQPILCAKEIKRLINYRPVFADDFHELPRIYQNTNIRRLADIFVAPEICPILYDKFMELILDGYRYRNPLSVTMTRFLFELAQRGETITNDKKPRAYQIIPPGMTTAPGSLLSGPSGSGKTSTLSAVLGIIPQVITHSGYDTERSFQQDQILWVSFDAPSTPSPKALCLNFMKAVDDALGIERYYPEYSRRSDNTSVDFHIIKVQEIAANHYIGLVHFDEMQFFLSYAKSRNAPNLQILEAMFNKLGIPVVISTTDGGLPLINANEQTKRRLVSEQHFRLKPLKPNSDEFIKFVQAVFHPKIWGEPDVLNNQAEFISKFHYLSAGLQAVMIRLARLHLFYSVQRGCSPFDINELKKVFDSQFHFMKDSLEALRVGNLESYELKTTKHQNGHVVWCDEEAEPQSEIDNQQEDTSAAKPKTETERETKTPSSREFHNPSLIRDL